MPLNITGILRCEDDRLAGADPIQLCQSHEPRSFQAIGKLGRTAIGDVLGVPHLESRTSRDVGFRTVRLDTVRNRGPAVRLLERHGFTEIPATMKIPPEDLFMELDLRSNADG